MQNSKRAIGILITILMLLITITGTTQAQPSEISSSQTSKFLDVTATDPNLIYINYMASKGIMKGYPDKTFRPAEGITRAEAAVVVVLAAGLKAEPSQQSTFKDVAIGYWAYPYIAAAQKAGYISGFPDKTFRPQEKITRAQGIAMLMKMCTQKDSASLPALQDMDQNHWAAEAMGVALAAQMIGLSPDGTKVYPDAELKRGSLARALGTLLIKDPGLYTKPLTGTLKEIQGQIELTRNGKTSTIQKDTPIYTGDTIKSGSQSSARLIYPDGSALLIDQNTEMTIKESKGREYIKRDGTSNTAVEYLNLDIKKGSLFGAVATKKEATPKAQTRNQRPLLASLNSHGLMAAQGKQPWYNTAEIKKVKVKVDMPWGVAAVRGTFLKVTVNQDGTCRVSCLTGTIDVSGSSGGTITLGGNQSGTIGQGGTGTPTGMSEQDQQQFSRVLGFIVESALDMDQQQEAAISLIVETPDNVPVEQQEQQLESTLEVILDALKDSGIELTQAVIDNLKEQLQQAQQQIPEGLNAPASITDSSSSGDSSSNNGSGQNATRDIIVDIAAIPDVTIPLTGGTPVTTITETAQYTGTVTWIPGDNPFLGGQVYTATITLTPKTGFTFTGAAENYFTVAGATATNPVNTGMVTAVFPATASSACQIIAVNSPAGTSISGNCISGSIGADSMTVDLTVSPNAAWGLYADSICENEIVNHQVPLVVGNNLYYIKVTAQNGTTNCYILEIYRKSNDATVTAVGSHYAVNNLDSTIQADQTVINTNVTVETFLTNLAKHGQASWKVVPEGTLISDQGQFDGSTEKALADTLMFGDQLAVKAEDGTIKIYAITVVLGDPIIGGGNNPGTPSGLKGACSGFTWGRYRYWLYDYMSNPWPPKICMVAFDQSNTEVQRWEINGGRYEIGISIDSANEQFSITTFQYESGSGPIYVPWNQVKIDQP